MIFISPGFLSVGLATTKTCFKNYSLYNCNFCSPLYKLTKGRVKKEDFFPAFCLSRPVTPAVAIDLRYLWLATVLGHFIPVFEGLKQH